jgi:hypothetical protein
VEEETNEGYVDNPEDIHMLQEGNNTMHLTQNDYEDSLNIKNKIPKSGSNEEVLSSTQYMMFVDALQVEMHRSMISDLDRNLLTRTANHNLRSLTQVFLWIKSKN